MEKQISIIIPTYNMEKYIGRCLDSLIIPEFDEVEVLVVNDGSKDRSSDIAHEYADKYPDSIRVIDKENGNYGSCINAGLPLATGRYVKILDADDYFSPAEFSKFVIGLRSSNADVIITTYQSVDEEGKIINQHDLKKWKIKTEVVYAGKDFFKIMRPTYFQMHQIAYRREIFSNIAYRQLEGISYTDMQWAIEPMSNCKSILFKEIPLYNYLVGRAGQTVSVYHTPKALSTHLNIMRHLCEIHRSINEQYRKKILANLITYHHSQLYRRGYELPFKEGLNLIREYDTSLREHYPDLYNQLDRLPEDGSIYKFVRQFRKSGYSPNIQLSILQRLCISSYIRFQSFKNKL